jgi:glycerol-3-phosphate acyltransferase PlsY
MFALAVKIILAYLLGSVSGSLLLGRFKKIDIRGVGSGNAGGTNAFRTQGLLFALGVVLIDVGKGFLAAWWLPGLTFGLSASPVDQGVIVVACSLAAIAGHCFPVWHGFRGGKGAATAVGALIVIEPWLLVPMIATWLLVLVLSGYVGLSTVLAGFSLVPVSWWIGDGLVLTFSIILALFLLFTHRSNMQRLRDGTEYRFEGIHLFSHKR